MTNRFTELKNNAYQSSQVIGAQLQSVESSLLGAFLSILITAFISARLGLLFWIPASFLSMWLVSVYSFVKSFGPLLLRLLLSILLILLLFILGLLLLIPLALIQRPLSSIRLTLLSILLRISRAEQKGNVQTSRSLSDVDTFSLTTGLKNATPIFKSIGVIFLVSLLSLLLYRSGNIGEGVTFSIWIPITSSILLMLLPILTNGVTAKLEKSKSKLDFTKLSCLPLLLIVVGSFIFTILALLVFPIWAFRVLGPIYIGGLPSILSIIVVMFLLVITALAFANYFSASLVRKEMSIALFRLSNIQNRIEDLLSNHRSISDEMYQELREEYTEAQPYNMTADDTLLVNYYSLRPNPTYPSKLDKQ